MASDIEGMVTGTEMAGSNRLEMLLFSLGDQQRFGINVFKVKEVVNCPVLTRIPDSHPVIRGIANVRGHTISVIDLAMAIGKKSPGNDQDLFVIITEYNREVHGFLVSRVERIVNLNWEEIKAPPSGLGKQSFLTAVTRIEDELVEIIDVEKVMGDVIGLSMEITGDLNKLPDKKELEGVNVLIVDDSSMARKQVTRLLDKMGISYTLAENGREAYDILSERTCNKDIPVYEQFTIVLSDVEMPEMDGYKLTSLIKEHEEMQDLYVMLHSSLSGSFIKNMVEKVGADEFVAKNNPDELLERILTAIRTVRSTGEKAA